MNRIVVAAAILVASCNGPAKGPIEPDTKFTRVVQSDETLYTTLAGLTLGSTVEDVVEKYGFDAFVYGKATQCNDKLRPGECFIFFKQTTDTFGGQPYKLSAEFKDYVLKRVHLAFEPKLDHDLCIDTYETMLDDLIQRYGPFFTPTGKDYEGDLRKTGESNPYRYSLDQSGFFIPQQRTFPGIPTEAMLATDSRAWSSANYVDVMAFYLSEDEPCNISVALNTGHEELTAHAGAGRDAR